MVIIYGSPFLFLDLSSIFSLFANNFRLHMEANVHFVRIAIYNIVFYIIKLKTENVSWNMMKPFIYFAKYDETIYIMLT